MSRDVEDRIAGLARSQHGVVTRTQLLELGLRSGAVRRRAKCGRLRRLHRGVYLVGPIMPPHASDMAAVLACGPTALLSHRSAAALWGMSSRPDDPDAVDVTVAGGHSTDRQGIRVRRVGRVQSHERTILNGLPVTAPGRTLVDLASVVGGRALEHAVAWSEREGLVGRTEISALIGQHKGRPGIPLLRAVLEAGGGPALTRSEAESRFLTLVRKARLPAPEANVTVDGYEIDFLWRIERIAVEVDGYRYHSSRPRFESDRRRTAHLAARGIQVIPLTWRQIVDDGLATAVQLGQALLRARRG